MLRNSPVPAKGTEMWTNYHHSPTLKPTSIASGLDCGRQAKAAGRGTGGERIWGSRRRSTDLLTTQTPRMKQAAQSAATHRVGTRAGEALCGLSAAAAIIVGVAGHLGWLLLVRKGGEGKRRAAPLPSPQVGRSA